MANISSYAPARQVATSAWQVIEQPPPPTLREILNAYKSKGDGDREMLLAMLNAKSSEDQRIAAMATLHHKLLELPPLSPTTTCPSSPQSLPTANRSTPHQPLMSYQASSSSSTTSSTTSSTSFSATTSASSPIALSSSRTKTLSVSPQSVTLPPIHIVSQHNPHKRSRSSQSPPPYQRRHSTNSPNEVLPPSPPFSSPGRSTACSELSAHPQPPRGDAMAIGSLLSSEQERDSEWSSRTSAERDRERDATYHKPSKASG